jgi:predicted alpha/beta hydrolase
MGEPVPKKAMLRWKNWCTDEDYLFSDPEMEPKHHEYSGPMMAWSFTDDTYAPLEAVEYLVDKYSSAKITRHHIDPKDVELEEIGHFGFFREQSRDLWSWIMEWIENNSN